MRALTRVEVNDQATEKVERITQRIKDLTKKVFSPVIKLKDLTVSTVGKIKQRLKDIATTFTPIVKIRDLASQGLAKIKNTLGGLRDRVTSVAVGIHDRAILHQGEKVLTRNQADQYDRAMSTRGVQLSDVKPIDRDPDPQDDKGGTGGTGNPQDGDTPKSGGIGSVTIEKLADTVIIEKEADTDKVVSDMVAKFKKLLPNMT